MNTMIKVCTQNKKRQPKCPHKTFPENFIMYIKSLQTDTKNKRMRKFSTSGSVLVLELQLDSVSHAGLLFRFETMVYCVAIPT